MRCQNHYRYATSFGTSLHSYTIKLRMYMYIHVPIRLEDMLKHKLKVPRKKTQQPVRGARIQTEYFPNTLSDSLQLYQYPSILASISTYEGEGYSLLPRPHTPKSEDNFISQNFLCGCVNLGARQAAVLYDVKILISGCRVYQLKCTPKPVCPNTCHWRMGCSSELLLPILPNKSVGTKFILHTALPINFTLFAAVQTNLLRSCTNFVDLTVTARTPAMPNDIFRGDPHFLQENAEAQPPLDHDRFLPNPFQIINQRSPYYFTLYDMIQHHTILAYAQKNAIRKLQNTQTYPPVTNFMELSHS
jgi:hypothetical protein